MSSSISSSSVFDLEDLLHVEQTFFDGGYKEGHAHGRTHGLIEGRALGQEKGYQLWEEIGFYEGFAKVWESVCQTNNGIEHTAKNRTEGHIRHLLDLVSQFPRINPSALPEGSNGPEDMELDITELLSKIRARYKALCATVGVKPRLLAVGPGTAIAEKSDVSQIQGKGRVWKLEDNQSHARATELSF